MSPRGQQSAQNRCFRAQARVPGRRASILVLVLMAIVIMTLTTSSYLLLMRNEHLAAHYSGNHLQTELLAQSGVDYLRVFLAQPTVDVELQGGLLDNPQLLQDVLVVDDSLPTYRGRFTVLAPNMVQGYYQNVRYGLENESAKLNLNSLVSGDESSAAGEQTPTSRDRLMFIPGMNEDVADAILDWVDQDDSTRSYGAESADYQSMTPAYQPRNGPLRHLDELLMIRGVTPELLYGVDINRNYQIDGNEQPVGALLQLDNTSGQLNRGWAAYLTVHSSEINQSPDGEPKIDLNGESLETLHGELVEALGIAEANFIIAYRQFGPAEASAEGSAVSAESIEIDFETEGESTIDSPLDLINAKVSIASESGSSSQLVESPWPDDAGTYRLAFADLLDAVTTDQSERTAGRININLASRPVLLTIPGMTEVLADQILSGREPIVDRLTGDQRHPTWLLAEGLATLEELKPMFPLLTTGGDVYSCQVVGFFDAGTACSRALILLDRSGEETKLLAWNDLSRLGPGFTRSILTAFIELEE